MGEDERADPGAGAFRGDDVLDWLRGPEALSVARRWVHRRQLPGGDATVDDVLSDATAAMFAHVQRNPSATYDRAAAYGSTLIRNATVQMLRDAPTRTEEWLDPSFDPPSPSVEPVDATIADGVRITLERSGSSEPWVTSAALSYLTLLLHPDGAPGGLPAPAAGSDERHARCWPALWIAGERAWFPDATEGEPGNLRRTRARRITKVLDRVDGAFESVRRAMLAEVDDGRDTERVAR